MQSVKFNFSGLNEERQSSTSTETDGCSGQSRKSTRSSRKGKTASTRSRTKPSTSSTKRSRTTSSPKTLRDEAEIARVTFGQPVLHNSIELLQEEECQDILTMDEDSQPVMELPVLDRYDEDFEAENRDSWIAYDEIDLNEKSQEDCDGGDLIEDIESGVAIDPRSKAVKILSKLEEGHTSRKNRCRMIWLGVLGLLFMLGVLIVIAVDLLTVPTNTSAPAPVPSSLLEEIPAAATVNQVSNKSAQIRKIPTGEGILLDGPSATGPTSRSSMIATKPPQPNQPLTVEGEGILTPRSSIMNFRVDHHPNQQSTGTGPAVSPNRQVKAPQSNRPTGTSPTTRSSTTSTRQPPRPRPKSLRFVAGKWVSAGN